jgi:hypothetical protein
MNGRSSIYTPSRPVVMASRVIRSQLVHAAIALGAAAWLVGMSITTLSAAEVSRLQTPRADTSSAGSSAEPVMLPARPYADHDIIFY